MAAPPDPSVEWQRRRERMVHEQLVNRWIRDPRVLAAMREVPREIFVAEDERPAAYRDMALPIHCGQTISQPYTVAFMLEALALDGTEKVLDVGTGSGYGAALLSQLAREVVSIERIPRLAEIATERLARQGCTNVRVIVGDGSRGSAADAPFDAITVAAAGKHVPPTLLEQLADGGRLVIPLGETLYSQALFLFRREGDRFAQQSLGAFNFVPLIGAEGWEEGEAEAAE